MARKRKNPIPILLLYSKKEQLRFINAVERIVSAANDLVIVARDLAAHRDAVMRRKAKSKDTEEKTPPVFADGSPAPF